VESVHELDADIDVHTVQRRQRGEARSLQPLRDRGRSIVKIIRRAKGAAPAKEKELACSRQLQAGHSKAIGPTGDHHRTSPRRLRWRWRPADPHRRPNWTGLVRPWWFQSKLQPGGATSVELVTVSDVPSSSSLPSS